MKKIILLTSLVLTAYLTKAQRFFYIESNQVTDQPVRSGLLKASQFITQTPLSSDYIIKADAFIQEGSNILSLKIVMEDSITFKTIFETNEEYTFGVLQTNTRLILRMAIATFIDKNISQIILSAKDDHSDGRMKLLKERKDKT